MWTQRCLSKAWLILCARSALESVLVYNQALDIHGIITQRDIVGLIIQTEWLNPCWQYASYPLIEIDSESSLFDAYRLMSDRNVRHLVVKNADICGVISFADLITEIESAYCCELERAIEQRDIALQKSQRNLFLANKIIDASLDGIMLTQRDGTIIQVNPAFTKLTGFAEHEVIGKRPSILSSTKHSRSFIRKCGMPLSTTEFGREKFVTAKKGEKSLLSG